jgi:thiol-disulfide isomerase/thioredoxin
VAKSPASKKNIASQRPATQAAKRPPARVPAKSSSGRPAGLFTWLAIGLVVIIVATLVLVKVLSGSPATTTKGSFTATDPATVAQLTGVPMSVFNTVGVTSTVVQVNAPIPVKGQPPLTAQTSSGTTAPEVFYLGAEYCPYCAAQRWSTIIALSRFGTWSGLGNTASYAHDTYPNTPSFTFVKAIYKSKYIVFKGVEEYTNYLNAAGTNYQLLQTPTKAEQALVVKYDTPKYIPGLTKSDGNPIPFMSLDNKFLVSGASFSPDTLTNLSRSAIATGLSDPSSPVTDAIIASANYQTAAICSLTNNMPSNVCSSSGVMAAKSAMKIK